MRPRRWLRRRRAGRPSTAGARGAGAGPGMGMGLRLGLVGLHLAEEAMVGLRVSRASPGGRGYGWA
eukprot:scaffold96538_cov63-Phaeocystis_antarctica.AAC.2